MANTELGDRPVPNPFRVAMLVGRVLAGVSAAVSLWRLFRRVR